MKYASLLFLVILLSCNETQKENTKTYPSDYLFAQRSFPYGVVDLKAYRSAIEQRKESLTLRSSFDGEWNSLGPTNICGRVTDIEMPVDNTEKIYAGTASGGIFISEDSGDNWEPIFDEASSLSIGDLAISKNNPQVIYAGTGESNAGGGSLAYDGIGLYRSDDGGENWTATGLETAGSIGRVVIDPEDDNTVFVAAMGELFTNSPNRGIYRTKDAGSSWEQVLFQSDSTGGIDLAIHPTDGNIVYAAMWERIRKPYNRQYGGETSGLFRSIDGGDTWEELLGGLPTDGEEKGRIGIAISESDPNILYAYYAAAQGSIRGIYRTDDGGDTWIEKSIDGITNVPFIWWFGKIVVHPTDPDDVYVTSLNMFRSIDGGNAWSQVFSEAHVDHHALYIHPNKTDLVLNGNDGGIHSGIGPTYDASNYLPGINNFQFYTCEIDPNNPDIIYGGSQDNGTNKYTGSPDSWRRIYGGDGFRVIVDPNDSDQIYMEFQYGGIGVSSDGGLSIESGRAGLDGAFNWNTPIAMDPNNTSVLYTGSQSLFRTIDRAGSWEEISSSLVNADNPMGNLTFGSLTTIDVTTQNGQVIYIGTDDGNVWVTKDAGSSYENISEGLPVRWITAVAHDPHNAAGVYVTVSGFRFGESESHVFYSENYGADWKPIGADLPDIPVNDIVVDGSKSGQLYVATDVGVYYSLDNGQAWQILGTGIPTVPVVDLDIHNSARLLAAASYGRGMFTYNLPEEVNLEALDKGNNLMMYPNPTSDIVKIEAKGATRKVRLLDMSGKVLSVSSELKIDLSPYSKGTYLIEVEYSTGERVSRKVVRQ